jgi:outer membrane autotransporter protein
VGDRASSGSSDSYHLGLYGGTEWDGLALRTGAAYAWHAVSTERDIVFAGYADAVEAGYDAGTAQVFAELGYAVPVGTANIEPFANLAYVHVRSDGFSETGGAAALSAASASADTSFTTLGLRATGAFALGSVNATAKGLVGWQHAFGDVSPVSTLAFAGGHTFAIAGVPITRDAALIEAGIDLSLSPRATLGIAYSGQAGSGFADQSVNANLDVRF